MKKNNISHNYKKKESRFFSFINKKNQLISGFTVIEMITVISIFGIMTGVLLFNYTQFQKNTDFGLFAQELGLLIKKQQQDAMSGKFPQIDPQIKQYPSTDWKPAYGVYLTVGTGVNIIEFYDVYNDPDPAQDHEYTINGGGGGCDSDPTDECLNIVTIASGRSIVGIYEGGYPGGTQLQDISIVFERPYPDARMKTGYQSFDVGSTQAVPVTGTVDILLQDNAVDGYNVLSINPVGAISVRRTQ